MISEIDVFNTIKNLDCPDIGFNFEDDDGILWGKDKSGNIAFGFYSKDLNTNPLIQSTQYLKLYINYPFSIKVGDKSIKRNISSIVLTSNDENYVNLFIKLTIAFSKNVDENKLLNYFIRLKELFAYSKHLSNYELQGIFGEFFVMLYFSDKYNEDVSQYYQREQKRKFDFSITDKKKIEIKTTLKPNRIHHFLQMQLDTSRYDIKVVSIMLQNDDKGASLYDLMNMCEQRFSNNIDLLVQINKIKKNNNKDDLERLKFNYEYSISSLRVFDAENMPKIEEKNDEGVFNVEFDCDLTNTIFLTDEELIKWIKQ